MQEVLIPIGLGFQVILVGVSGFFIRRWIVSVEKKGDCNTSEIKEKSEVLFHTIERHRSERRQDIQRIVDSIDKLSDHVATANGRTSKLEIKLHTQMALCRERNGGRRITDKCQSSEESEE